jgi:release factor glutamine methyltransferase
MSLHCTWADLMRDAAARLKAAGIEQPQRDARLLLAHALNVEPSGVIVREQDAADGARLADFEAAISRRLAGEPVSRIRGWRDFHGLRLAISEAVLDPRPDTETLVEAAIARLPPGGRLLDLGTGSGCILLSVLAVRPDASGAGVDVSPAALEVARRNALDLGLWDRGLFLEGGWDAAARLGRFEVVVSNPPYIPSGELATLDREVREFDPRLALDGGADGLDAYRAITALAPELLTPGGHLLLEVGRGQADAVLGLAEANRLLPMGALEDLAGIRRVVAARLPLGGATSAPGKKSMRALGGRGQKG